MKWQFIPMLFVLFLLVACGAPAAAPQAEEADSSNSEASAQSVEATGAESAAQPLVTVYKSPTCGCCEDWITHMEESGYVVEAHDTNDLVSVKSENHVPSQLQSCHTAIIDGYVIEGHVPAEDINQLLAERPDVTGLAVPGMPVGSPGMEVDGYDAQPFDVIAFDQAGDVQVFASHNQE
jgi:hypothetical protein